MRKPDKFLVLSRSFRYLFLYQKTIFYELFLTFLFLVKNERKGSKTKSPRVYFDIFFTNFLWYNEVALRVSEMMLDNSAGFEVYPHEYPRNH